MSRCLILGGTGFIGQNLVNALIRSGETVTVLSRTPSEIFKDTRVEHVVGDFADGNLIKNLVRTHDVVFHLISSTIPGNSNQHPERDVLENLLPTIHLITEMSKSRNKKLIYLSSGGAIYGNNKRTPLVEDTESWPISSYGITKMAIEKHIFMHATKGEITARIVRASNPYGPLQTGANNQGVIANFVRKALTNEKITVWGDGSVIRDYIFIDDLSSALLKLLEYSGDKLIFNIGSGQPTSIKDLLSLLEKTLDLRLDISFTPARDVDVSANVLDISRAMTELNWEPKIKLPQGLETTVNWWKSVLVI